VYTNLYVYIALPIDMTGKLYWRIKKNGKWTWVRLHPLVLELIEEQDLWYEQVFQEEE
jgi:hypothetical protein